MTGEDATDCRLQEPMGEPLLPPIGPYQRRSGGIYPLAAALALHAGFIALMCVPLSSDLGAGGSESEAIGIEIVSSAVLDSLELAAREAARAAAIAAVAADPGTVAESVPPVPDEHDRAEPRPAEVIPPDAIAADQQLQTAADSAAEPVQADPPRETLPPAKEPPAEAAAVGGPAAAGLTAETTEPAPARSAAQAGAVNRFLAGIRSRLARNRPRGQGRKGLVIVTFSILPTGALEYARVSSSSGNTALDEAALAAVRRSAPFAPPPGILRAPELVFSIPYRFD